MKDTAERNPFGLAVGAARARIRGRLSHQRANVFPAIRSKCDPNDGDGEVNALYPIDPRAGSTRWVFDPLAAAGSRRPRPFELPRPPQRGELIEANPEAFLDQTVEAIHPGMGGEHRKPDRPWWALFLFSPLAVGSVEHSAAAQDVPGMRGAGQAGSEGLPVLRPSLRGRLMPL